MTLIRSRIFKLFLALLSLEQGHGFAPSLQLTAAAAGPQRSLRQRLRLAMVGSVYDSAAVVGGLAEEDAAVGVADLDLVNPHHHEPRNPLEPAFSPVEVWCLVRIEQWYSQALSRKCPFLRRRHTDLVETLEMLVRDVVIRDTNIPLVGPTVSCRGDERTRRKSKGLSMQELAEVIRHDWRQDAGDKGYYITGRLTPQIYRDDCLFDGPDPDMPVKGLRKFLNAASQLFDPKQSRCELQSLEIKLHEGEDGEQEEVIVAKWIMNGVLRLPWQPKMPQVQGVTTYRFDEDGLIKSHEETWDLTAVQAFWKTGWLDFKNMEGHHHHSEGHSPEHV